MFAAGSNVAEGRENGIRWMILSGACANSRLYSDAGEGLGYLSGGFSWQNARYIEGANQEVFDFSAADPRFVRDASPKAYEFIFRNVGAYRKVTVNGETLNVVPPGGSRSGIWSSSGSDDLYVRLV